MPSVGDFFATGCATDACAWRARPIELVEFERHVSEGEQSFVAPCGVCSSLQRVAIRPLSPNQVPEIATRRDSNGAPGVFIKECGSQLPVVEETQRPFARLTPCDRLDAVDGTAVCLGGHDQPFCPVWHRHAQRLRTRDGKPRTEDQSRTTVSAVQPDGGADSVVGCRVSRAEFRKRFCRSNRQLSLMPELPTPEHLLSRGGCQARRKQYREVNFGVCLDEHDVRIVRDLLQEFGRRFVAGRKRDGETVARKKQGCRRAARPDAIRRLAGQVDSMVCPLYPRCAESALVQAFDEFRAKRRFSRP